MPKGVKLTEEHKEKIRQSRLGQKLSEEHKRKIGKANKGTTTWNKGIPWSGETRKKMSENNKGMKGRKHSEKTRKKMSEARLGKKSHLWKGGITPENQKIRKGIEYRLWREAVFARDNWICQKTGIKGGKLCCHHILNFADYPELRTSIENGITLSLKAHQEFHKVHGIKNTTKEQLNEFLSKG